MVQENSLNKIIVVCGPTGSGKSKLAVELALKYNGEVISADSVAIYKHLNVGSAKPTIEEKKQTAKPTTIDDIFAENKKYIEELEKEKEALALKQETLDIQL